MGSITFKKQTHVRHMEKGCEITLSSSQPGRTTEMCSGQKLGQYSRLSKSEYGKLRVRTLFAVGACVKTIRSDLEFASHRETRQAQR